MDAVNKEELVRAFHLMWDNYPEMVRLIDRKFNIKWAVRTASSAIPEIPPFTRAARL